MLTPPEPEDAILLIADHASNAIPPGLELGVPADVLHRHIAVDIGTGELARRMSLELRAPCLLAGVSRLVIDLNRDARDASAMPETSDGIAIPGNSALSPAARARRKSFHEAYHDALREQIESQTPQLLVSLHSFTPRLADDCEMRPWDAGLLYDRDRRAAGLAIDWLSERGYRVGDNEPYSGAAFGYTMQRHAEARGLPYLFIEVRQDHLASPAGIDRWVMQLAEMVRYVADRLTAESRDV